MEETCQSRVFIDGLTIGPAWTHNTLCVHPLIAAAAGTRAYLTTDEALATQSFRVSEISKSGRVPELKVHNNLSQPVLLLDGEALIGAKQNRVLNLSIMVPAQTEMNIPVSCVEAGRWRHVSDTFAAADHAYYARGRAQKVAQVSYAMREFGSRSSDQTAVWSEIAAKSRRMSAASPTAAMAAIYESSRESLDGFVAEMPRQEGQVGAVFSIQGRMAGIDVFDCADTFAKAAPKLMRSYALDALESAPPSVSNDADGDGVRAFLDDIESANVTRFKALGLGEDLRLQGRDFTGAALEVSGHIVHLVSFRDGLHEIHQA
jgi:hypothetical protein